MTSKHSKSKHNKVTDASPVIVAEREAVEEASHSNVGQAWVKANPNIVRMVLAAYPHWGKTVLMTKEEFAEKSSTRQGRKNVSETGFSA